MNSRNHHRINEAKMKTIWISVLLAAAAVCLVFGLFYLWERKQPHAWTVTQYGVPGATKQSLFYTIRSDTGKLAVIDGGWTDDAEAVRQVIETNGGHVDVWILTHPLPDHIGAFCEIWENPGNITIGEIDTIYMNYDDYNAKKQEWDEFDIFERFYADSRDMKNLHYLHEGEELSLLGLKMQVFNAFEDSYNEITNDLANDGSLVFRISGKTDSMLFLADLGAPRNDYLLSSYGEEMKSEYVQMGHHGNSSLSDAFYENIGAKGAFFDAPDFLLYGAQYKTEHYMELMKNLGAEIYTYKTAPNSITLK
jgi:beta-lactamase superfamily II metal-dependent hydrolase